MTSKQTTRSANRIVAALAVLTLVLAACGTDEPDAAAPDETGPADGLEPVEPLEVAVPGTEIGVFWTLPWFIAQDLGFFEQHGADINVRALGPGIDGARAVQTGEVDLGVWVTGGLVSMAANVDPSLRIIFGIEQDDWLVASSDPDVQTCEDLEGLQDVAVDSVGGARWIILQTVLESCGLSIDDVSTVDFGGTVIVESMSAGTITTSVLHIDELVRISQFLDEPLTEVEYYINVVDDLHFVVAYVREETLEEHREHVIRYLAGLIEAFRFLTDEANLDETAQIAVERTTIGEDLDVAREAIVAYIESGFFRADDSGLVESGINAEVQGRIDVDDIEGGDALWFDDLVVADLWDEAMARVDG